MKTFAALIALLFSASSIFSQDAKPPVRVAMYGLEHDHAYGFIPLTRNRTDAILVGIVEPDQALVATYAKRFGLSNELFFPTIEALRAKTKVDAMAVFTSTLGHRAVVEKCAPLHIDVMVEKPLAVNIEEARIMKKLAEQGGIEIIVNYETTWYPANLAIEKMNSKDHAFGDIRKMVIHDGHRGPREIGCSETFLKWLTNPTENGGGALTDFGCYGADLMTWLMWGQRPVSVFAVTQQIKPDLYPAVEDEATIIVTYPKAQGIIQASWNWPFDRKDMEVYGKTGYAIAPTRDTLRIRKAGEAETLETLEKQNPGAWRDQLAYLVATVRHEVKPVGPSSLDANMIVTEILDAARESAKTGRRIDLPAK